MIPYGKQWIEEDDIQAVVDVLRSDYLTTGPKIQEFERAVADYVEQLRFMRLVLRQELEKGMK